MQHLDDGIIHALLDGELSDADAEALNEHVRYCAVCADRLAEERLIQSEAERMIAELDAPDPAQEVAAAPPPEMAEPPLPVIPEQPMASGPPVVLMPERDYERSRLPRILGWAATLVVAAGAGYFASVARQPARAPSIALPEVGLPDAAEGGAFVTDSGAVDSQAMAKASGPADSDEAATAARGADVRTGADAAPLIVEEAENEREPQAVATPPAPAPAPAQTRAAEQPPAQALAREREAVPRDAAQRDAAQRESAQREAVRRETVSTPASGGVAAESDRTAADRSDAVAPAAAAPSAAARAPATPSALEQQAQIRMRIGLDETQRMLGSPLHVVDGLQQQFVGLVDGRLVQGANPNAPVVRVVYLDDRRRPIYLDQQRLDGARRQMGAARDTIPPDWVKGDVWLSLKGALSAEELAAMAQRVR